MTTADNDDYVLAVSSRGIPTGGRFAARDGASAKECLRRHTCAAWRRLRTAKDGCYGLDTNVTTSIAAAAALISLATLIPTAISTSRRENRKCARDALSQAFLEVVDPSLAFSDALGDVQRGLWDSTYEPRLDQSQRILDKAELADGVRRNAGRLATAATQPNTAIGRSRSRGDYPAARAFTNGRPRA